MNVFVDANVLLGFYGLSRAELEELRKLAALVKEGEITLWVPRHLTDEVERNREKTIAEVLKPLQESRLNITLPKLSEGLPQRQALQDSNAELQKAHSALLVELQGIAARKGFEADRIIVDLFAHAESLDTSVLLPRARSRRELRNPPGKGDSLGDALHWEALLEGVPSGQDIHVVSTDPDFRSVLVDTELHPFLRSEWQKKRAATACLYSDLGTFTRQHFPQVNLATDVPKFRAISELASSSNFACTHAVVARLAQFDLFTPEQATLLLRAAAENSQVLWIATDADVYLLLKRVLEAHRAHVDPGIVALLEQAMHPVALSPEDDDELAI